jgi:NADPH:quinone reductase
VGIAGRSGSDIEARELWANNNALRGVFLGGVLMNEYPRVHAMIADLLQQLASGSLRVIIDRTFPLAEAAAAHEYIESRQAFGRVVMTP